MEVLHQSEEIVAERYRIVNILGQGGIGTTYEAEDLHTGKRVALKGLSLERMTEWKVLELFEREARVLSHLNHPSIPKYLDYFQVDAPKSHSFYLVQELAKGRSLFSLVQSGWHATESEIRQIAVQILNILSYLHGLAPSVIHRDIKPQNIILDGDGQIFLVDFSSVQASYQNTLIGGNTVVGTYGYMAPEQYRGQAFPATDLYGLGATLLFLVTHRSPADLPLRLLKNDRHLNRSISSEFIDWLEKLMEPLVGDRFLSAKEASSVLRGEGVLVPKHRQPVRSRIAFTNTGRRIVAEIPPKGWKYWDFGEFILAWLWIFFPFLLTSLIDLDMTDINNPVVWFFSLYFILSWMIGSVKLKDSLFKLWGRTRLVIERKNFRFQWFLLGCIYQVQGETKDIERVELNTVMRLEDKWLAPLKNEIPQPITVCSLVEGIRTHCIGLFLTKSEKEWLAQELADFLRKPLRTIGVPE